MISDEERNIIASARPQDVVAAVSGVGLKTVVLVLRALRMYGKARGDVRIDGLDDAISDLFDQCVSQGADERGLTTKPNSIDVDLCNAALDIIDEYSGYLNDSSMCIRERKYSRWFPSVKQRS